MYAILCNYVPRSVNAEKKVGYYKCIVDSFKHYHGTVTLLTENLYGFVCYFHKVRTQLDADNLSKPIWDALKQTAYADDKLIKFRSSGILDLQAEGIELLDLSDMPEYLLDDFLRMIESEDHILYIEFGRFDYGVFQFARER